MFKRKPKEVKIPRPKFLALGRYSMAPERFGYQNDTHDYQKYVLGSILDTHDYVRYLNRYTYVDFENGTFGWQLIEVLAP